MSDRTRAFGALLVPVVLALFIFRGFIFLGELPFRRDMGILFVPLKHVFTEVLHTGRLPQWWPWDGLGKPLLGVPLLSVFHPSTLFFLVLPFQAAFVLQVLSPLPLALLGTWRLGRALGLRPVFSALAATAYAFGGYFLDLTEFTFMSLAAGALPWLWWGALRCRREWRWSPGVLGLALASMLLAGDPQLCIMGLLGAGVLVLRRGPVRRLARPVGSLVLGTLLAVGLAAIQLMPTFFLFLESPRAGPGGPLGVDSWPLEWPQLLCMVSPGVYPSGFSLFETTYVGLGVMALAFAGAATRGRVRWQLVGIAGVSLVLALGRVTPLWDVFSAVVPFWKAFRYPIKAIGPAMLVLPLLAARGAQSVLRPGRRRWLPVGWCVLGAVAQAFTGLWGPSLLCLLLAGLLAAVAWKRTLAPVLTHAMLVVVAVDLGVANNEVVETVAADYYEPPPLAEVLQRGGISLEGQCYIYQWHAPDRMVGHLTQMNVLQGAALAPIRGALHGLPACDAYLEGFSARYADLASGRKRDVWLAGLAGVFGARYLITTADMLESDQRKRILYTDELSDAVVWPLPNVLPRAYVVRGVKVLPRAQVVDYLRAGFRMGQEVVLEEEAAGAGQLAHEPEGMAKAAQSIRRMGDAVEVEVTLEEPGMLVLNESYFQGVEASEGGQALKLYPANHAVRAVALGAGHHVVRFEYHTPGLVVGALTSGGVGALLAVLGVLRTRRARRARAERTP